MEQTKTQKATNKKGWLHELGSWLVALVVALVIVIFVRMFLFTIISVDGSSMDDTLASGDRLYVSVLTPRLMGYERGDVVICRYPEADHLCVKRIIGLPGDRVEMVRGVTYVNGEAIDEPYITHQTLSGFAEVTLAEGEYFVMGDNRPISHDSRAQNVGPVTEIVGKARWVIWPLNRLGNIE